MSRQILARKEKSFSCTDDSAKIVIVYRLEYYCMREGPFWQPYRPDPTWWILGNAIRAAKALIWQYHDARVLDSASRIVYQNGNTP